LIGQENRSQYQESQNILTWLSSLEFPLQQNDFISRRQEGTGKWLIKSDEFKTWVNGTREILFCPGIPGAGKTILTSIVIDHLSNTVQDRSVGVAYIYCNYQSQSEQTPISLLASVLKQLLQNRLLIPDEVKDLYQSHISRKTTPTLDEVLKVLHSEMSRYSQVYVLVDALDECNDKDGQRQILVSKLRALQAANAVNLMVTSRFNPKIEKEFEKAQKLEIRASDEDVHRYLEGQMDRLSSCITENVDLQKLIISKIIDVVDGM